MAAALDPRFVIAPSLEMYFVDKDSGLPMSFGQVFFFQNDQPNVPKDVFELSLVGGVYTYTPLPNPVTLSSVGTFQDGDGNNILPYYFPYDDEGNVELYYIEVYNSAGVLQFTRIAWPNFITENVEGDQSITNFIPNGQFLLHNNAPPNEPLSGAQVETTLNYGGTVGNLDVYEIAQGGWTFEKNDGSTAVDSVTFPRYGSAIELPTGNPRFAVQITTTVAGSDTSKDLCIKFPSVNQFASETQEYNFYFEAQTVTGAINNIPIFIRKYFGAGGSTTTETEVDTISLVNSIQKYNITLLFGTNENETIGPNDDDFVQIVIRLPPTGIQNVLFTNFALTLNPAILTAFPVQTNAEQFDESITGWVPTPFAPDGSNFYLPIVLTPTGATYDDTIVGKIYASPLPPEDTELLCDGTSYPANGYSSLGIPYSRLANKYFNNVNAIMAYGTGYEFLNTYLGLTNTNLDFLFQNTAGANAFPTDAASVPQKTGFTFTKVLTGIASANQIAWLISSSTILVRTNALFSFAAPNAATSGFTITVLRNSPSASLVYTVGVTAASSITGGTYFTFATNTGSYYIWFKVNGTGTDPAPGGTGIEVDLLSTWNVTEVAYAVAAALNQFQGSTITFTAGSSIPAGSYFTFSTNVDTNDYYVWYTVNGVGINPMVASTMGIQVNILSADTANQVAIKTLTALNKFYVGVPDLRGLFLRGQDPDFIFDQDAGLRLGIIYTNTGNNLGTLEIDQYLSHFHPPAAGTAYTMAITPAGSGTLAAGNTRGSVTNTGNAGGDEVRPYNSAVNWVIRY